MKPLPADAAWARLQRWKRPFEILFWVGLVLFDATADAVTVMIEVSRLDLDFATWEPVLWEFSSAFVAILLVPPIVWFTRRHPPALADWKHLLALYAGASLLWSAAHVAGMVAIRKVVYTLAGSEYDFGDVPLEFAYEYLKDVRSFATIVLIIEAYRLVLRRWQGEASVPQPSEHVPAGPGARAERFLVRKLGKEFLVAVVDIDWMQASANYVNLHVGGRVYPLRGTLAQVEAQLDPARFRRVHRSYIVNLDRIEQIEPTEAGDARILMRDGARVPCSRRYRAALRPDLGTAPA